MWFREKVMKLIWKSFGNYLIKTEEVVVKRSKIVKKCPPPWMITAKTWYNISPLQHNKNKNGILMDPQENFAML